jgi:hypothetical protein
MAPTITEMNHRKRQVDRPYGESITSVDAYIKLKKTESTRKRKITKENQKVAQTDAKQDKKYVFLINQ